MTDLFALSRRLASNIDLKTIIEKKEVSGLFGTAKAAFLAALSMKAGCDVVFAARNADSAEQIYNELKIFLDPSQAKLKYFGKDEGPGNIAALFSLLSNDRSLIVTLQAALEKKTYSPNKIGQDLIKAVKGASHDTLWPAEKLVDIGYSRVFSVEDEGEFSIRGGIIDIFSPGTGPVRIEMSSDKIESIRDFDVLTQRSKGHIESADIYPVREKAEEEFYKHLKKGTLIIFDEGKEKNLGPGILKEHCQVDFNTLPKSDTALDTGCRLAPEYSSMIEPFIDDIKSSEEEVYIISKQEARLKELFLDAGLSKSSVKIVRGEIVQGFHFPSQKIVLFSDREIFGEHIPRRRFRVSGERAEKKLFTGLKEGDAVVHKNYGIGIYEGMKVQEVDGTSADYLYIRYAGGDRLYLPSSQIHLISKYNVPADSIPPLNSLTSKEWSRIKSRARRSIRDMTKELLEIYSSRKEGCGFAFPADGPWQAELEGSFPYEDTKDQAEATRAVKSDMESSRPMDRLLCADVGYGKTEVALRAAFKAISSGKQAALLCPTTILSQQHYQLFRERLAPFPFTVEVLSRFKTSGEQKDILKKISAGSIDVVIGTHRLLQKDIAFKDLGILIIDEEQKFGVAHKEKLKQFKRTVDVLSLSATPIPRTLYMALSGIWDMSVIETPPPGRSRVETEVLPWKESIIKQAVEREKERGGQVFYVYNRVETIFSVAEKLKNIVPEASIAIAHGKMKPDELEDVMLGFIDGKYDMLVSTSIIESGLDLPNVNTIIIEDPEKFGLSTLYQLRGRVGRSNVKAYAYLLYREGRGLSEKALERLSAIRSFTALGSGHKIALRDLEIRGAGDVLGSQQHGHLLSVGFDLYCDMLKEAAAQIRGEKVERRHRTQIDIKIDAFIPASYIEEESERMDIYKRADIAGTLDGVKELEDELKDRFGELPQETANLFEIVKLGVRSSIKGIKSIIQKGCRLIIETKTGKKQVFIEEGAGRPVLDRINKIIDDPGD